MDSTLEKRRITHVSLFKLIAKERNATWLHRNMITVLSYHELAAQGVPPGSNSEPLANDWEPPEPEEIERIERATQGHLEVRVDSIIPTAVILTGTQDVPSNVLGLDCDVGIRIWSADGDGSEQQVYQDSADGLLQGYHFGGCRTEFDIIHAPFKIQLSKISIFQSLGERWKKVIGLRYRLEASISLRDSKHAKSFLAFFHDKDEGPRRRGMPFRLCATYDGLPACPSSNQLIPLSYEISGSKRNFQTAYGLRMQCRWKVTQNSILETHKWALRLAQPSQHRPPNPPDTPPRTGDVEQYTFDYHFVDLCESKRVRKHEPVCPFCLNRNFRTPKFVLFHLKSFHGDFFDFAINRLREPQRGLPGWIKISILSKELEKSHPTGPEAAQNVLGWISPAYPFNITEYLEGNDTWMSEGNVLAECAHSGGRSPPELASNAERIASPERVLGIAPVTPKTYPVPAAPNGVTFFRAVSKRPLQEGEMLSESDDEVDDHMIKIKRATLIRRYPERWREFLVLFDNHFEDEMLLGDAHVGNALVRFLRAHGDRIRAEKEAGNPNMLNALLQKVEELATNKIISPLHRDYVKEICHLPDRTSAAERQPRSSLKRELLSPSQEVSSKRPKLNTRSHLVERVGLHNQRRLAGRRARRGETGSDSTKPIQISDSDSELELGPEDDVIHGTEWRRRTKSSSMTAREPDGGPRRVGGRMHLNPPAKKLCFCGQPVFKPRDVIYCSNARCFRLKFHMSCVGLSHRTENWICSDCEGADLLSPSLQLRPRSI